MPFIGPLLTAAAALIRTKAGVWVAAIMTWMGLQFAVQQYAVSPFLTYVRNQVGSTAGAAAAWLGFLNVDNYITLVLSAYAVAAGRRVFLTKKFGT